MKRIFNHNFLKFKLLLMIFFGNSLSLSSGEEVLFVIGKYDPARHPDFVNLKDSGIPVKDKDMFLQREAAIALKKMYEDLQKEHPGIPFWITSATRTYRHQKTIWEKKWSSYENIKEPEKRAEMILQYSSMPGSSRHHWGTDFDINILENSYYLQGEGKLLWEWLSKNSKKYGFCQPYNGNRKNGHLEEKWHWSYYPKAREYQKLWNRYYREGKILPLLDFSGAAYFTVFAEIYVNSINPECLEE